MKVVVFFSTFSNRKQAQIFARAVVDQRLAACVNVLGKIESHYFWKSKRYKSPEVLIMGKTTAANFKKLKTKIKSLHPYEVPELIAIDVADGLKAYLDWIKS